MNNEWNCPRDCPNRHIGCQNPDTCEIYKARVERAEKISSDREVLPLKYINRSTPMYRNSTRKYRGRNMSERGL